MWNIFETYDSHLWLTVIAPDVDMALRKAIARQLLHNLDGMLRSKAYWWMQVNNGKFKNALRQRASK